jgi:hypothetical protein
MPRAIALAERGECHGGVHRRDGIFWSRSELTFGSFYRPTTGPRRSILSLEQLVDALEKTRRLVVGWSDLGRTFEQLDGPIEAVRRPAKSSVEIVGLVEIGIELERRRILGLGFG